MLHHRDEHHRDRRRGAFAALALTGAFVFAATSAPAATIVVDATVDDLDLGVTGNCTLREAIEAANTNAPVDGCTGGDALPTVDEIQVPAGTYTLTIQGVGVGNNAIGNLNVTEDVVIAGAGAPDTVIDGWPLTFGTGYGTGVLGIDAGVAEVSGVTVEGGFIYGGGGGISVARPAALTLLDSTVRDNAALAGGGLAVAGALTMSGCTVEGNFAVYRGSALYMDGNADVDIANSTLSGNTVEGDEGGTIANFAVQAPGHLALTHVTIASNTASQASVLLGGAAPGQGPITVIRNSLLDGDCVDIGAGTAWSSFGGNLESPGDTCALTQASDQPSVPDPLIGPLQLNGGTTETHALLAASPARDAISGLCLTTDQTGYARPGGPECDVGAWEYRGSGCAVGSAPSVARALDVPLVLVAGLALAATRRRRVRAT